LTLDSSGDAGLAATAGKPGLGVLQRLGRSLMLPIAALPVAALLLRLGQPDMLGAGDSGLALASRWPWLEPVAMVLAAAGGVLFTNIGLLFAVGVAVGFARRSDGSTALAAVVGYLVFDAVTAAMSPYVLEPGSDPTAATEIDYGVFGGILVGITAALLWQRYYRITLPPYLAFFGGRRFVPIVTALATTLLGVALSFPFPWFDAGLHRLGETLVENDVLGAGIYGFVNRLLIPFGLHHLLNSVPWFAVGAYEVDGMVYRGDIARFLHGDPTAGAFMTGFFPIMMFALPAAALAIYHEARPERRKLVGGVMLSGALTSFLTGVTEPLEFAFMFVAWPLFVIHALLTGTALALVNALGIKDGFAFSAGAIDYALNFTTATDPLLLVPIGLGYAAVYYVVFRAMIRRFDLRTPGREHDEDGVPDGLATEPASADGPARPTD
jgi:PTS system N-acetylglucosamine-specific IIC component